MEVLQPLAHALFPGIGSYLGHHHSFIVRYKVGEDLGLDMHTDDSDVTYNICLGKEFSGAGLTFCGMMSKSTTASFRTCTSTSSDARSCTSATSGTAPTTSRRASATTSSSGTTTTTTEKTTPSASRRRATRRRTARTTR